MMIIWNNDPSFTPDAEIRALMEIAAERSLQAEGIGIPCSISVRCCGEEEIRMVNREQRNIDCATDVLSFPTVCYPHGLTAGSCETAIRKEFDDDSGTCFLGDILISIPRMKAQAEEYGHSEYREAAFLLVHGVCHLMGYDHILDQDRRKMRSMEEIIMNETGISREGPACDETLLAVARKAREFSYSPYSHFSVGAALLGKSGRIYSGCNIENASFGVTNCAERTALFKAVSEGERDFDTIAIAAPRMAWPCGVCRQALNEFAPNLRILTTWENGKTAECNLRQLLPDSFDPGVLLKEEC